MNPTKSRDQQISNKSAGVENSQPAYKEKRKKKGKKKKTEFCWPNPKEHSWMDLNSKHFTIAEMKTPPRDNQERAWYKPCTCLGSEGRG
jgi:hypothetical protein